MTDLPENPQPKEEPKVMEVGNIQAIHKQFSAKCAGFADGTSLPEKNDAQLIATLVIKLFRGMSAYGLAQKEDYLVNAALAPASHEACKNAINEFYIFFRDIRTYASLWLPDQHSQVFFNALENLVQKRNRIQASLEEYDNFYEVTDPEERIKYRNIRIETGAMLEEFSLRSKELADSIEKFPEFAN